MFGAVEFPTRHGGPIGGGRPFEVDVAGPAPEAEARRGPGRLGDRVGAHLLAGLVEISSAVEGPEERIAGAHEPLVLRLGLGADEHVVEIERRRVDLAVAVGVVFDDRGIAVDAGSFEGASDFGGGVEAEAGDAFGFGDADAFARAHLVGAVTGRRRKSPIDQVRHSKLSGLKIPEQTIRLIAFGKMRILAPAIRTRGLIINERWRYDPLFVEFFVSGPSAGILVPNPAVVYVRIVPDPGHVRRLFAIVRVVCRRSIGMND